VNSAYVDLRPFVFKLRVISVIRVIIRVIRAIKSLKLRVYIEYKECYIVFCSVIQCVIQTAGVNAVLYGVIQCFEADGVMTASL
jgi:hypothetical protein